MAQGNGSTTRELGDLGALAMAPATPEMKSSGVACLGPNLRARWVLVTPTLAAALLEGNSQNRRLRKARVELYARVMTRGQWRVTHQGIAIDRTGRVVDAQHRLHAIIESGVSVWMLMVEGADPLTRLSVDNHVPRTAADSLGLIRGEDFRLKGAIVNVIRTGLYLRTEKLTSDELADLIDKYERGLSWISSVPRPTGRLGIAPVLGAFVYAYPAAPEIVATAYQEYTEGSVTASEPMGRLREFVLGDSSSRSGSALIRTEVFRKTLSAIHARVHGEPSIHRLYILAESKWAFFKKAHGE